VYVTVAGLCGNLVDKDRCLLAACCFMKIALSGSMWQQCVVWHLAQDVTSFSGTCWPCDNRQQYKTWHSWWCCAMLKTSGTWCCAVRCAVPSIWEDHEPEGKDTVILQTSGPSYPLTQGSIPEDWNLSFHQ